MWGTSPWWLILNNDNEKKQTDKNYENTNNVGDYGQRRGTGLPTVWYESAASDASFQFSSGRSSENVTYTLLQ